MKNIFMMTVLAVLLAIPIQAKGEWFDKVLSEKLSNASGEEVAAAEALKGKMVGIYFSASWCGPCRAFTPKLVDFYKKTAKKNKLEIVFCSCDRSADAMMKYMEKDSMPWLALPFDDPARQTLLKTLNIRGIPALIIFNRSGKIITRNGRGDVTKYGAKAVSVWKKAKPGAKSKIKNFNSIKSK